MLFFVGSNCENQRDDRGLTFFGGGAGMKASMPVLRDEDTSVAHL